LIETYVDDDLVVVMDFDLMWWDARGIFMALVRVSQWMSPLFFQFKHCFVGFWVSENMVESDKFFLTA
jgi:hypothetical protein